VRAGVDIKLDIRQTLDGQLVVLHDDTVDRTTNGKGRVVDFDLAQLQSLDAGSWFHADFRGERVPTFEEVLALTIEKERRPTTIAIDLKVTGTSVAGKLARAIARYGLFERTFLFGMSLEDASGIERLDGRIRCAATALSAAEIRRALQLDFVDVIWTGRQPKNVIDEVHGRGKQIYFTLINDAAEWMAAQADGVDGICTNHPLEMKRVASPRPQQFWDHYLSPDRRLKYDYRNPDEGTKGRNVPITALRALLANSLKY